MGLCFLANCRSLKDDGGSSLTLNLNHQPKYLSSYSLRAHKFPVGELKAIHGQQPYIFLPPLCLDENGQVSENYALSITENKKDSNEDDSGTIYAYRSNFTTRAKGYSGFIDVLTTFFDQSATQFYTYKMPQNLDQAMMVKYYYRIKDDSTLKLSNEQYQIVLIISIEWMKIEGQNMQLEPVWKGEMVLNLSQSIRWMEGINLGYQKLSQYVLKEGTKKDRLNFLDF